jgi:hypothetical protein
MGGAVFRAPSIRFYPRQPAAAAAGGMPIAELPRDGFCLEGGVMAVSWREQRFGELLALRANDPALLVSLYCQLVGLYTSSQLPPGVSFMTMIDALLDAEALQRQSDASSDKSASG